MPRIIIRDIPEFTKGGWIQKAVAGMRKDKPCTGSKFGGPSCTSGSRRYNLAKTFKKIAASRKKEFGGPVNDEKPILKHGGNPDMAKYHNMSPEDYEKMDKMMRSVGSRMMKFGGNLKTMRRNPAEKRGGFKKPNMQGGGFTPVEYAGYGASAMGPALDLYYGTKPIEKVTYPTVTPKTVNYQASINMAIQELDRQRNAAVSAARDTASNAQEYLAAVRGIDADVARRKSEIIARGGESQENVNAQILNEMNLRNATIKQAEIESNQAALAARREYGRSGAYALGDIGTSFARDIGTSKYREREMKMWEDYYKKPVDEDATSDASLYPHSVPAVSTDYLSPSLLGVPGAKKHQEGAPYAQPYLPEETTYTKPGLLRRFQILTMPYYNSIGTKYNYFEPYLSEELVGVPGAKKPQEGAPYVYQD